MNLKVFTIWPFIEKFASLRLRTSGTSSGFLAGATRGSKGSFKCQRNGVHVFCQCSTYPNSIILIPPNCGGGWELLLLYILGKRDVVKKYHLFPSYRVFSDHSTQNRNKSSLILLSCSIKLCVIYVTYKSQQCN